MRRNLLYSAAAATALMVAACGGRNVIEEPVLKFIEGRVVASTMNDMTLLTGPGDTVIVSTEEADPFLVPGVLLGDVVRVGCTLGKNESGTVLNADTLAFLKHSPYFYIKGSWISRTASDIVGTEEDPRYPAFDFRSDGTAKATNIPNYKLKTWNLSDSTFTLISVSNVTKGKGKNAKVEEMEVTDIFTVTRIDESSLILSRGDRVVWDLVRKN